MYEVPASLINIIKLFNSNPAAPLSSPSHTSTNLHTPPHTPTHLSTHPYTPLQTPLHTSIHSSPQTRRGELAFPLAVWQSPKLWALGFGLWVFNALVS